MRENHWFQYQNGILDEGTWISYRQALRGVVFSSEVGRSLWQEAIETDTYAPGFRDSVNELLAQGPLDDDECGSVAIEC